VSRPLGIVYFIRCGDSGPIKIGYTAKPINGRLNGMQCGNPEPLHLLATMPGDRGLEQSLHELFAVHRQAREWFRATPELLWLIDELARDAYAPRTPEPVHGLRERIYGLGRDMVNRMRAAQQASQQIDPEVEEIVRASIRSSRQMRRRRAAAG